MTDRRTGAADGSAAWPFSPIDPAGATVPAVWYGRPAEDGAKPGHGWSGAQGGAATGHGFGIALPGTHAAAGQAAPMIQPQTKAARTGVATGQLATGQSATGQLATGQLAGAPGAPSSGQSVTTEDGVSSAAMSAAILASPAATPASQAPSPQPSAPQLIDFHTSAPIMLGSGFSASLPSSLDPTFTPQNIGGSGDGFSATGTISGSGGLTGGITATAPGILPNIPLMMNPETVGYVQQQQVFRVAPTLISTDDAGFSLNMPTSTEQVNLGLNLAGSIHLGFPSVDIGFSLLGHFIGYSFSPPSVDKSFSGGGSVALQGANLPGGGSITARNIGSSTAQSTLVSQSYGLPTMTETFTTDPFFEASFDAVRAMAEKTGALSGLSNSIDFKVGNASWDLFSLPLTASFSLADTITMSEAGFTAGLKETVGGSTTDLGTHAVTVGTQQGQEWDITAPPYSGSGYGVIRLDLDYKLTLNVQSVISLFGTIGLALEGPQASASLLGEGFGFGPVGSVQILNKSGDLGDLSTSTEQVTLESHQYDLVFYGTKTASQTLTTSTNMSYTVGASGELLTVASGVYISPAVNSAGSTIGILATLGAAGVYNYGNIYAQPGSGSAGIDLAKGAKIVNSGAINPTGGSHFRGTIQYGVEIGGSYSTVINTGKIGGAGVAGAGVKSTTPAGGRAVYLSVYNNGTSAFIGGGQYGIEAGNSALAVHNDGTISSSGIGVDARGAGVILFNNATGHIDGSQYGVYGATSVTFIQNEGQIGTGGANYGVDVTIGDVFNFGTIEGSSVGVRVGIAGNGLSVLENAGLIAAGSKSAYAVKMLGQANTLMIAPGASFVGQVYANGNYVGSNVIQLLTGASTGTLTFDVGSSGFYGWGRIDIASGASWLLETPANVGFNGATISGLSSLDQIKFMGQSFQYGDSATLNSKTGALSLLDPNGTTLSTVMVDPTGLQGARFHLTAGYFSTYLREFTGAHFSNVITSTVPGQIINANSYFGMNAGQALTIAHDVGVEYNDPGYPVRGFGLDLQPVTLTSTVTSGGTTTVSHALQTAVVYNDGFIEGNQQGVLLQTTGTIHNTNQILANLVAIQQSAGVGDALIDNEAGGFIYGKHIGIVLNSSGTIANHGEIVGTIDAISAVNTVTVENAGLITGLNAAGIVMTQTGIVLNGSAGTITGGANGVLATGTTVNVTNAGSIGGKVGVSLANGGGVANTYNMVGGVPVWGTISGNTFAVAISGASGTVVNGYGTVAGGASPALIQGVSLGAGGIIVNGRYGVIEGKSTYSIVLAPPAAGTVSNAGSIGAIHASRGDLIGNATGGTIQSITGVGGPATSTLSIQNAGVIGAGAAAAGISTNVATYLYNAGSVENGIQFLGGGTIVDSGALYGGNGENAITFGTIASRLVLQPQAYLGGTIAANAVDTLELAGVGGFIAYLGNHYTGFGTSILDAGAVWAFGNGNTLTGNWTIAGSMTSDSPVTSTGTVSITGMVAGYHGINNGPLSGTPGEVGLYVADGTVSNAGVILGSWSGYQIPASVGVVITGGTVINSGSIAGGNGVYRSSYGGNGVSLTGGVLINSGQISAGSSQNATFNNYYGQAGVVISGSATLSNSGLIVGGYGNRFGGAGVLLTSGLLENTGTIQGSAGGQTGGVGVTVTGGVLVNGGTISGANGAHAVDFANAGATLTLEPGAAFNGLVVGAGTGDVLELSGTAGSLSGLGTEFVNFPEITEDRGSAWTLVGVNTLSAGVTLATAGTLVVAGSLLNAGVIAAQAPQYGAGYPGYLGISLASGTLTNTGTLAGSYGRYLEAPGYGGNGGGGVAASGGVLVNNGLIEGAAGAVGGHAYDPSFSGHSGDGGVGVSLGTGASLTNTGTIAGGGGGPSYGGGAGLALQGGTAMNKGLILGGRGYAHGGAGVYLDGGLLTNAGTITGGTNGSAQADAVQFGTAAGTLALAAGAVFNGVVAANAAAQDTLLLQANRGTLSGLGTEFTGFSTLAVASGSIWTVKQSQTFGGAVSLAGTLSLSGASLTLDGALSGAGRFVLGAGTTLDLGGSGTIAQAVTGPGTLDIQGSLALAGSGVKGGVVRIDAGGTLAGTGALTGSVQDSGLLAASGGTLAVGGKLSGTGTLAAMAGSVLELTKGGVLAQAVSGAGTLDLAGVWTGTPAAMSVAALAIEAHGSFSRNGVLSSSVQVAGTLSALAGTLSVRGAVSGVGTLSSGTGRLVLGGGGSFAGHLDGSGTISLASAMTLNSGAILGVTTLVDSANLTLGAGVVLANASGRVFDLQAAAKTAITASGATGDSLINAGVMLANGLGSATVQMSFMNSGTLTNTGGTLILAGTVANSGTIQASSGLLDIQQHVGGTGQMTVGATGTLSLDGTISAAQTIDLMHAGGTLDVGSPLAFLATIKDFAGSGGVDLLRTTATSESYANNVLSLKNGAKVVGRLSFAGTYTAANFALKSDGHGGTMITSA